MARVISHIRSEIEEDRAVEDDILLIWHSNCLPDRFPSKLRFFRFMKVVRQLIYSTLSLILRLADSYYHPRKSFDGFL